MELNNKSWSKEGGGVVMVFGVMAFFFPINHYAWWSLPSWAWLNTCLPMGSGKWIPSFVLFACMAFPLPSQLPLSQSTNSCTSTFLFISPIPPGDSEWVVVWYLAACQGKNTTVLFDAQCRTQRFRDDDRFDYSMQEQILDITAV